MKRVAILLSVLALPLISSAQSGDGGRLASNVDPKTGAISVPENYTEWPTLGTWAHANSGERLEGMGPGVYEYHVVYTQVETLRFYKQKGRFPDGAVLVKELLHAESMPMTTGPSVGHGTTISGWFVLVRDTKGRHEGSPLWGDGWGWSLFDADDPRHTVSKNYKADCIPCHIPARQFAPPGAADHDKWIYTLGYPVLRQDRLRLEKPPEP